MADLTTNLERLATARDNITTAIIAKGGTVNTGDGFEDFPSDIATITNTYTASDNGKVVKNGVLSSQTNYGTVTSNGTYTTTYNNKIKVNIPNVMTGIYYPLLNYGNYDCRTDGGIIIETATNIYIMMYGFKYSSSRNVEFTLQSTGIQHLINSMSNVTLDSSISLCASGQYVINRDCTIRYSTDINKYGILIPTTGDVIPVGYITFIAIYNIN